jgi:energy-coupling factor transporter ATP-binding protein EcfA2
MATITVTDLTVRLGDPPTTVLDRVTFSAAPGSIVLIVGANGSGKSVLFRTILGLHTPNAGTVAIDGVALTGGTVSAFHQRCGVTFQNTDLQIFGDTVEEDLRIGKEHLTRPDDRFLGSFGLESLLRRAPGELSGGQRRRLALAGAFYGSPEFLLFDEPFIELDYPHILQLLERVREARNRGATVLIASHDTRDIWQISDRVILLDGGRVKADGPPSDVAGQIGPAVGLRPINPQDGGRG